MRRASTRISTRAQLYSGLHAFRKRPRGCRCAGSGCFVFTDVHYLYKIFYRCTLWGGAHFLHLESRFSRRHVHGLRGFSVYNVTRRGAARTDAVMSEAARKTLVAAVNSSFRFWESSYVLYGRINLRTYSHVRCDTSHLSFVFRYTARLFRRYRVRFEIWDALSPVFPSRERRVEIRRFMRVGEERNVLLSILSRDGRKGRRDS